VRTIDRRGQESPLSSSVTATPLPDVKEPVFVASLTKPPEGVCLDGHRVKGQLHGDARIADGGLELGVSGFATFESQPEFAIRKAFSVECWVRIDQPASMPVVLAAGAFNSDGWFLQRYGDGWRWHLAPLSCDGGRPVVGRWTHLVGTFDGRRACLYQDGQLVAKVDGVPNRAPYRGPLVLGQYSSQGPSYQVHGGLKGVRLYARALRPADVAANFRDGSGTP
jgi:hypothetical protein